MTPVLLLIVLVLSCISVVLFVVLVEVLHASPSKYLRRWRIAWSKRRKINDALKRAESADARRIAADHEAHEAEKRATHATTVAEDRVAHMGSYIVGEQSGEHIKGIRVSNYHAKEKKILRAIDVAQRYGYTLPNEDRQQLVRMLKQAHKKAIKIEQEREEQARIKEQMREEEKARREAERAIREAEKVARIKEQALKEAIALLGDQHSDAIDQLKADLAEAQAAVQRTKSMAEQTKAGHIYIISNWGSFGKGVFKVGMTRRLEPLDRVRELGDASVPFTFDVHAMISCDDAPALENALHKALHEHRVNKVNLRKEFFRIDLATIIALVKKHHGEVEYQADPEALEYLETLAIERDDETVESRFGG